MILKARDTPGPFGLARFDGATTKQFYHNDYLGSARAMTNAGGSRVWTRDYYPFVRLRAGSFGSDRVAIGDTNVWKFTGKPWDSEVGLFDFGARNYDPELGRWTQVDPLASKYPGWSPYNYALNNPLKYVDPDGREIINAQSQAAQAVRSAMQLTSMGRSMWAAMENSPTRVTINIDQNTTIRKNGGIKTGEARLSGPPVRAGNGKYVAKSATVIFFTKAKNAFLRNNQINSDSQTSGDDAFSNAIGVHEATHVDQDLSSESIDENEDRAEGNEAKAIKEIKDLDEHRAKE